VSISDAPDPVTLGGNLTYTITVTNHGPAAATGVAVRVRFAGRAAVVSVESGTCTDRPSPTCEIDVGSLPSGAAATRTLVVRPTRRGQIDATARVRGDERDPVNANDNASTTTTVN
jgi:hypothetical protein